LGPLERLIRILLSRKEVWHFALQIKVPLSLLISFVLSKWMLCFNVLCMFILLTLWIKLKAKLIQVKCRVQFEFEFLILFYSSTLKCAYLSILCTMLNESFVMFENCSWFLIFLHCMQHLLMKWSGCFLECW